MITIGETKMETVEMEVFRVGDYGAKGRYSEADLQMLAEDYRPDLLEAPLTFDHAQSGPAYGWVERLRAEGGRLFAVLGGVPDAVRDLVRAGRYRRRSVELIRSLKETGRPYLRAVTLLGAATPEVKGMRAIAFREGDDGGDPVSAIGCRVGDDAAADCDRDCESESRGGEVGSSTCTVNEHEHEREAGRRRVVAEQLELELGLGRTDDSDSDSDTDPDRVSSTSTASLSTSTRDEGGDLVGELEELRQLRGTVALLRREIRARAAEGLFAELRSEGLCIPERDAAALRHIAEFCEEETVTFSEGESVPLMEWLAEFVRGRGLRVPLESAPVQFSEGGTSHEAGPWYPARTDPRSMELHRRAVSLLAQEPELGYAAALAKAWAA